MSELWGKIQCFSLTLDSIAILVIFFFTEKVLLYHEVDYLVIAVWKKKNVPTVQGWKDDLTLRRYQRFLRTGFQNNSLSYLLL